MRTLTLAVLIGTASGVSIPSSYAATTSPLIELPEGTVEGSLPNGLRYIILRNDYPAKRAEFRLIWKIGAVQQNDDQGGCAHFLEHIAFGGSTNFPDRAAVAYLESQGMKYGIDINAFTGHDRTIYMFGFPTDSVATQGYTKPLEIIADWMGRLTINPQRVETEKGIILEELRSTFQEDRFYDLKIGQNRFSSRMPLGTPGEVEKVTADVLENFYRTWYIPGFATIVVVGDVEPAEVEKAIRRQFSFLKKKKDPGFRTYTLDYSPSRQIMTDVDSLNTRDKVEIIIPHPTTVTRTLDDARTKAMGKVVTDALGFRLSAKGIDAEISDNWYLGSTNHFVLKAGEGHGMSVDSCISAISSEIAGILAEGFGNDEIRYHAGKAAKRAADDIHSGYSSSMWCDDFADYVISGDRYISSAAQARLLGDAVRTISAAEATAMLREWVGHADTMLFAVSTGPDNASRFTVEALLADWQRGLSMPASGFSFSEPVVAKTDTVPIPEILTVRRVAIPDAVKSHRVYESLGLHDIRLSNGMRLLVRPTLDESEVYFAMLGPGGYGAVPLNELPLYGSTASYIDMGGLNKSPGQLGEYMYQNDMALATALENDWHGFLGAFAPHKANEFFNLVYEKITDPELRYDEFEEIKESMLDDLGTEHESVLGKMLARDPARQLTARLNELMCNVLSADQAYKGVDDSMEARRRDIQRMNLDSIAAFYRALYTQPENCVAILSGKFDTDSMVQAFAQVFSHLKADGDAPRGFTGLALPDSTVIERFPNRNESQTEFDCIYFGRFEPGLRNSLVLKLMSNILRNRIIADLREKKALVYSPYVLLNYEGLPRGYYYFDINSSSDNAKMPAVREALRQVIEDLRQNPVSDAELNALKKSCIIAKREALSPYSPSAWRTTLLTLLKNGEEIEDFDRYDDIIQSITPAEIRDAFAKYINPELYVMLYMSDQTLE